MSRYASLPWWVLLAGVSCGAPPAASPPPTAVVVHEAAPGQPALASSWRPRLPPPPPAGSAERIQRIERCASDAIDKSTARDQFRGGVIAFEQADYAAALETFLRVYEKTCTAAVLYNIGAALEQMNLPQEAADVFEIFLEKHPETNREQELRQRIEMLRQSR